MSLIHRRDILLVKEESEAQACIAERLKAEGVSVYLAAKPEEVRYHDHQFIITILQGDRREVVEAD